MDTGVAINIVGFVVEITIVVLSIGHYTGKSEENIKGLQEQISQVAKDQRGTHKELQNHKENHGQLRTQVAVNDARLTESINGMQKEMKELKDTMKEFTEEMRIWMRPK